MYQNTSVISLLIKAKEMSRRKADPNLVISRMTLGETARESKNKFGTQIKK